MAKNEADASPHGLPRHPAATRGFIGNVCLLGKASGCVFMAHSSFFERLGGDVFFQSSEATCGRGDAPLPSAARAARDAQNRFEERYGGWERRHNKVGPGRRGRGTSATPRGMGAPTPCSLEKEGGKKQNRLWWRPWARPMRRPETGTRGDAGTFRGGRAPPRTKRLLRGPGRALRGDDGVRLARGRAGAGLRHECLRQDRGFPGRCGGRRTTPFKEKRRQGRVGRRVERPRGKGCIFGKGKQRERTSVRRTCARKANDEGGFANASSRTSGTPAASAGIGFVANL